MPVLRSDYWNVINHRKVLETRAVQTKNNMAATATVGQISTTPHFAVARTTGW